MDLHGPLSTGVSPGRSALGVAGRGLGVTAVLGPTNTGKTHFAIERMLGHPSGIIGLPLRLLAREVYTRVVERAGPEAVALITGEEKIKPKHPRYWVATVEAMPRDLDVSFLAIDEIQIAANLDRGHVFTDRLLNRRGRDETLIIGAMTMRKAIEQLLPGAAVVSRPRLSKLTFAGEKKLSRLPRRSAIVAFSAEEVYAIAELIRRQRGGAAVVLGALSPRTRNHQVAMYQDGDVDYLVATDAIGMGLNLDVDHVAFAGDRKFDGWQYRRLNRAEFGQIAGRAGRHLRDGTFGTTGRCAPFDEEEIEALEDHRFDPIDILQWRNSDLDFSTVEGLQASLDRSPREAGLTRAPVAEDVMVLDIAARDPDVRRQSKTRADIARLWDVCQVPDYRKVSPAAHSDLVLTLYGFVVRAGRIPDDWFDRQLALFDRTDGDIDTLSARIAQVRTLTYIANRPDWLRDPEHWQGVARQVEDRLSDALHERLALRFVDRRTSVLMRRLRENAMLEAEVTPQGDVLVEGQNVGQLHGFRFTPDPSAAGEAARALNAAAVKALAGEIEARAERFSAAVDESIALANDGTIRWLGDPIAKLAAGDKLLAPRARLLADEHLTGPALDTVQRRLDLWLGQHVRKLLGPVMDLEPGEGLDGLARGIAYQAAEALGVLERSRVAEETRSLDQAARGQLRKLGLRFGAYHIYLPQSLKPAPRALASQLWALKHGGGETVKGLEEVPYFAASGRTSFPADKSVPRGLYRAAGFRVCGERAVRVDILERLADLIRAAIAYRPGVTPGVPPSGAADNNGFVTTVSMTSLAGCSGEDFASILRSLGYMSERRPGPAITVPLLPESSTVPLTPNLTDGSIGDAASPVEAAQEAGTGEPAAIQEARRASDLSDHVETAVSAGDGLTGSAQPGSMPEAAGGEDEQVAATADDAGHGEPPLAGTPDEGADTTAGPDGEPVDSGPAQSPSELTSEPVAATDSIGAVSSPVDTLAPIDTLAPSDSMDASANPGQDGAAPAPAAEPVLIEVWRPHRASHAERRGERSRPQSRGPGRPGEQRQRHHERTARSGTDDAPAVPTEAGASSPSAEPRSRPDGRDSRSNGPVRRDGPRRGDHPGSGHAGSRQGSRASQPRDGGGRKQDYDNRRHRDTHDRFDTGRPMSRERQPDPDSPFAKLLALKAELEGRPKKD